MGKSKLWRSFFSIDENQAITIIDAVVGGVAILNASNGAGWCQWIGRCAFCKLETDLSDISNRGWVFCLCCATIFLCHLHDVSWNANAPDVT